MGVGVDAPPRAPRGLELEGADVVAVLTRAPSSGGKTRLFAALGIPPDPELLTSLLLDTLDGVDAPAVHRGVVVSPPDGVEEVRALAPEVSVIAQAGETLGDRMRNAMRHFLALGAKSVVVVGSDLPAITPAHVLSTVALLNENPAALVLGPAHDGGYYLIAARSIPPVFDGIAWGTCDVFDQTNQQARAAGWPLSVLGSMRDVDTVPDLIDAANSCPRSRTARWVGRLMPQLVQPADGRA